MAGRIRFVGRVKNDDRGAQAVEFALLWVFALGPIIYGLIAFGFIMNYQITASQLAREVARTVAICSSGSGATTTTCNSAGSTKFSAVKPNGFNGIVSVDSSGCFLSTKTDAIATVTLTSSSFLLPVPFPSSVVGKATTPCGG